VALVALAVLLVYLCVMAGPYLRAIVVRDAAVTSWITIAFTPIPGRVDDNPLRPGERVGADGRIAAVLNERADPVALARAQAELDQIQTIHDEFLAQVGALEEIVANRTLAAETFADAYTRDLQDEYAAAHARVDFIAKALAHETSEAERQERMMSEGASSQTEADLARARSTDRERQLSDARDALDRIERRIAAAADGAYMLADGDDAGDAQRSLEDARAQLEIARADHAGVEAELAARGAVLAAAEDAFAKSSHAIVSAPAGALIWTLVAGPGAEIETGAPVATWIDCSILLVDVPLSDLEAALLTVGAPANVVIDGERTARQGTVLLTRGSAATLAFEDLAAVATGRSAGDGQAIVVLTASADDVAECPIGRSAAVDFPEIGVLDMIAARLRL
jgi:multidrug resistance efflux pump